MKNEVCCSNEHTRNNSIWDSESNQDSYNKPRPAKDTYRSNPSSNYQKTGNSYHNKDYRFNNKYDCRDRRFESNFGYARSNSFVSQGRSNSVTSVPRFTGRRSNSKYSVNTFNDDTDSLQQRPQMNSRCEEFGRFLRERGKNEYNRNFRNNYPNRDLNDMLPSNPELEKRLFSQPSAGINFDEYEKIPVSCSGNDPPKPLLDFSECEMHKIVANNVSLANYTKPTPVQKYAIPTILGRRDMMACAQTGSGKTAAFLLPLISMMLSGPVPPSRGRWKKSPICLILTPTRELCIQIFEEAKKFAYRSHMKIVVVYGGTRVSSQIREVELGVDLLVATPGRLIDLLERGVITLQYLRYVVLDEADRMLDMGFEPQIRRIFDDFDMSPVGERQTLMFSATFPKAIQELAAAFLQDYVYLCVGRVGSTSENITQHILWVPEDEKPLLLVDILNSFDESILVLIFVETRKGADTLKHFLLRYNYEVACIHGDRNQQEREAALRTFKSGETPILVATAVAARGLDVPNVRHVINYDMPNGIDEYVHRIGRTGRVGNVGEATSFFNESNANMASDLINLLEECHQEIPDFLRSVSDASNAKSKYGGVRRGGNRRMNNSYQTFDCRLSSRTRTNVIQRSTDTYDASSQSCFDKSHTSSNERHDWWNDDSSEVSQIV